VKLFSARSRILAFPNGPEKFTDSQNTAHIKAERKKFHYSTVKGTREGKKSLKDEISFDNIPSRCAKLINFDVANTMEGGDGEKESRSLSLYRKFLMQFIMIAVGDLHSIIALKCPGCLLHIISIKSLLLIFIYGPTCVVGPFFSSSLLSGKNQPLRVSEG
jgi:hypothetical protein